MESVYVSVSGQQKHWELEGIWSRFHHYKEVVEEVLLDPQ